jgi:PAS domain S-box-containing protein
MKTNNQIDLFTIYDTMNDVIYAINSEFEIIYKNKQFETKYKNNEQYVSCDFIKPSVIIDSAFVNKISTLFSGSNPVCFNFSQNHNRKTTEFTCQRMFLENSDPIVLILEKSNEIYNDNLIEKILEQDSVYKIFFQNMAESLVLYKVITNDIGKAVDFEYIAVNKAFENSVGISNEFLKGKLLFQLFPNTEAYWKELHIDAFEQQKLVKTIAYSVETDKHWELSAFPAGEEKIATLASDVSKEINYKKNIKEKSDQLSFTEEKLKAYNEHLKYTCELIKESELSYKTLFEQNNDAILILVEGIIKDCNNKALQLMNCQPYELVGKTLLSLSSDKQPKYNDVTMLQKNFCEKLQPDEKYSMDWQIQRPDGKLVDTNILLSCYTLENTKHVYAIVKDLTQEKTLVENIKENEYLLEQAQRTAKLGHWSYSVVPEEIMKWSDEMKRILEIDEPISFFEFFKKMVHPEDMPKVRATFDFFTKIPKDFDLQFRIITPSNKNKFIHLKGEVHSLINKRICRGIIQDITSNYEQEERILFESKINETLANAGAELISPALPIDNIVRTIFKACLELTHSETGFVAYDDPLSDKILLHFYDDSYFNEKKVSNNIYFIERNKYKSEGLYGHAINLCSFDVNNTFNKAPIRNIGNTTPLIIRNFLTFPSVINDVFTGQIVLINSPQGFTDQHNSAIKTLSNIYGLAVYRKRMEWDLIAAKEKAEESDRLKSAFLANMSHEIRTPMNAIVGFSQLLIHSNLSEEKKFEFGQLINNSCEDLLTIVNDIIDISKIEAGQLLIIPKNINLSQMLNEIYNLAINKALLRDKSYPIKLESNLPHDLEWVVDVVRFKQIFLNLIDNAIKFTEKGSVTLGCKITNKKWIRFYVKDTGIGIPRNELNTIFESFRQVETTFDRTYGGTGLGLAISKNLVLQMGGSIKVESKENAGSEFSFDLPLRLTTINDFGTLNELENPINLNFKNKKVLIVEDEIRNARLLKFYLEECGAEIFIAYDGEEALYTAKINPPDLVLLDIKIPKMNGVEVLTILKQLHPNLHIIVQTAYAMKEDEQKYMAHGCDAYISKPVKQEELLELIRQVLE